MVAVLSSVLFRGGVEGYLLELLLEAIDRAIVPVGFFETIVHDIAHPVFLNS